MALQKVDFDDIATSCGNLKNIAVSLDGTGEVTSQAVTKIKDPTWGGDASESYASELKGLVDNIPEANRQLALSVLFLASCADGYEKLGQDSVKLLKDIVGGQDYIDRYDVNNAPTPDLNARISDTYGKEKTNSEEQNENQNEQNNNNDKDSNNQNNQNKQNNQNHNGNSSNGNNGNNYNNNNAAALSGLLASTGAYVTNPAEEEKKDIKEKVKKVGTTTVDKEKLDDQGKYFFDSDKFKYKDGYAMYDNYYLIDCDSSIGKVGDVIRFTLEDGTEVTCIVASNKTTGETINFITEKDSTESDKVKDLLDKSSKIENCGGCKDELGIDLPAKTYDFGNLDMDNYPKDINNKEAAYERGVLVAKYLMQNGGFTAEQAAALVGVYIDENGCYPGVIDSAVRQNEMANFGEGYGAGIGSWTTVGVKHAVLTDAGYPTSTKIENLSLKEQCDLIIANSQKSSKKYYDALKRCDSIEDASATAAVMTGGVGFSNNWDSHPTAADAKNMAEYYAQANDKTYGYSAYHHNADVRRLETAKEVYSRLQQA